jgi:hypothetical protein
VGVVRLIYEERLEAHIRVVAIAAKDEGKTEKGK